MLIVDDVAFAHPGGPQYRFALTVAPGEIVAVTGASGAGKSTLLDLIAGFLRPVSGRILLDGADLTALGPERRPVSILFQDDNLFEHLSAARNVALGLPRNLPRPEAEARVRRALADMELEDFAGRRAADLSGGQKQRVALARTMVRDRPVLLLDEPFSALDAETAAAIRALVGRLTRQRNWHVVMVTHQEADIAALGARRTHIADGVLQELS